jgi:hypothetical protein
LFEGISLAMRTIDEIAHVIMKNPAQLSMEKCEVVVRHSKLAVSVVGNVETSAGGI